MYDENDMKKMKDGKEEEKSEQVPSPFYSTLVSIVFL